MNTELLSVSKTKQNPCFLGLYSIEQQIQTNERKEKKQFYHFQSVGRTEKVYPETRTEKRYEFERIR